MQTEDAVVFHNLTIGWEGDDIILSQKNDFRPPAVVYLAPKGTDIPEDVDIRNIPGVITRMVADPNPRPASIVLSKAQLMTVIAALLKFTDEPESHPGKL